MARLIKRMTRRRAELHTTAPYTHIAYWWGQLMMRLGLARDGAEHGGETTQPRRWPATAALIAIALLAVVLSLPARASAESLPALATECPTCATSAGGDRVINIYGEMNGTPPLKWYGGDVPPTQGWAAQATQALSTIETASQAGNSTAQAVGGGLMGTGGEAGVLASPANLVEAIGPVSLAATDAVLLVHDGKLLYKALFGSAGGSTGAPDNEQVLAWFTCCDVEGSISSSWEGPNAGSAEKTVGDDIWNAPGWLALYGWAGDNSTVVPYGHTWPAPSGGTYVNIYANDYVDNNYYWGDHFYYLLARNVPGAIAPYASGTKTDVTFQSPSLPSRATVASNLNTDLAQSEYHTLRLELQHLLSPRCYPDPTSSTVVVPSILDNETPADYQSCLQTFGLKMSQVTLSATYTGAANGSVTESNPEEGQVVAPGSTVQIAVNPPVAKISQPDPRCDVDNGTGTVGDPGNAPSDGTNYPAYQLVQGSPYPVSKDPSGSSPAVTQMPLRWGTVRWGYRHLRRTHPYAAQDRQDTMNALATDQLPQATGYTATKQYDFHYFYSEPDGAGKGGTVTCVRTARAEYIQDRAAKNAGVTGIRGLQNSFVGLYLGGVPGH